MVYEENLGEFNFVNGSNEILYNAIAESLAWMFWRNYKNTVSYYEYNR